MNKMYFDRIFLHQMLRQMLGAINRTVLSARATERHLQIGKIALNKPRYMMINKRIHGIQESQYLAVVLQEVNDRLIKAREGLVLLVLTRVMGGTAIEHIPAAVTGRVCRNTAFKRKGVDRY